MTLRSRAARGAANVILTPSRGRWPHPRSPVIVGDRIFTCADPCMLICLNKADGKILWQRESSYDDVSLPSDVKQQYETEQKQAQAWDRQRGVIERDMAAVSRSARDLHMSRQAVEPIVQVLRKIADELRNHVNALPVYSRYSKPFMHPTGGISMCTPACDGKRVFVCFGNGLVACYNLDGNRLWLRLVEHSTAAYGHAASPLLVGDKLLVHYADLLALDVKDGSELWRDKIPPKHGTSIHTQIGGVDVAIHPSGLLVRVDDGKILADKLGQNGENSPILQDGIAYWIAGSGREYQELGRNKLDTFRSSPVFEGKRMYVRTIKNLYCIGE